MPWCTVLCLLNNTSSLQVIYNIYMCMCRVVCKCVRLYVCFYVCRAHQTFQLEYQIISSSYNRSLRDAITVLNKLSCRLIDKYQFANESLRCWINVNRSSALCSLSLLSIRPASLSVSCSVSLPPLPPCGTDAVPLYISLAAGPSSNKTIDNLS